MFSFFKKPDARIAFIFDISTAAVSGAIVKLEKNKPARILYSVRNNQDISFSNDSDKLLLNTKKILKSTAEKISREGYLHLNFSGNRKLPIVFYCFLSSPWAISETKVLKYEKANMVFSKSLFESIVGREEEQLEKSLVSRFEASLPEGFVLLDKKTIEIKLNGYATAKPFGKIASSAEIAVFLGMASERAVASFREIIQGVFHKANDVRFHTLTLASSRSVLDIADTDDFWIIDVTGESADVLCINDGLITESVSLPLARNQIIRKLASKFATTEGEALSVLKMFNEKSLSAELSDKISEAIKDYGKDFVTTLKEVVTTPITGKIFILSDKEMEPLAKMWLQEISGAKIINLDKTILANRSKGAPSADSFIMLESIFLAKIFNLQNK